MSQSNPTPEEIDAYAKAYLFGDNPGDQVKAWRVAFPNSKAKPESQHVKASEMSALDRVQLRIRDLRIETAEIAKAEHGVTVESLIAELEEARELAKETGTPSALVAATMGKAKIAEIGIKVDHSSSDGSMATRGRTLDDFYADVPAKPKP